MNCIALDENNKILGQFLYSDENNAYLRSIEGAKALLFFSNNESIDGDLMFIDGNICEFALEETEETTVINRIFRWEKYLSTGVYPENPLEVYHNQMHMYSGNSEETVPYPMPEEEIKIIKTTMTVIKETYVPFSVINL